MPKKKKKSAGNNKQQTETPEKKGVEQKHVAEEIKEKVSALHIESGSYENALVPLDAVTVLEGFNPRESTEDVEELQKSIGAVGLIVPLTVWRDDNVYRVICGHRRLDAVTALGLKEIPVVIRTDIVNADQALLLAIEENSVDVRINLTPFEEAKAYQRLMAKGYNKVEISMSLNCSRGKIDRILKILSASADVQDLYRDHKLTGNAVETFVDLDPSTQMLIKDDLEDITTSAQLKRLIAQKRAQAQKKIRKTGSQDSVDVELESKGAITDKGKHLKGVYRGPKDILTQALNIYAVYKDEKAVARIRKLEYALAALLWVMGEISEIDPDNDEFNSALESLAQDYENVAEEYEDVDAEDEEEVDDDEVDDVDEDDEVDDVEEDDEVDEDDEYSEYEDDDDEADDDYNSIDDFDEDEEEEEYEDDE